jgi:hypothetical protein
LVGWCMPLWLCMQSVSNPSASQGHWQLELSLPHALLVLLLMLMLMCHQVACCRVVCQGCA